MKVSFSLSLNQPIGLPLANVSHTCMSESDQVGAMLTAVVAK